MCDGGQEEDRGGVKKFGATLTRRGPVVPKGTLRAPVSPFQTTVWHYGDSEHEEIWGLGVGGGYQNKDRGHTEKRERWKKRRRGGEQTDNHTTSTGNTHQNANLHVSHLFQLYSQFSFPTTCVPTFFKIIFMQPIFSEKHPPRQKYRDHQKFMEQAQSEIHFMCSGQKSCGDCECYATNEHVRHNVFF